MLTSRARNTSQLVKLVIVALLLPAASGCFAERWFKGNTHTHSWWSDGDSPPEMVVDWYKQHGYNFLVLSDHNTLSDHERWVPADERRAKAAAAYEQAYGPDWIVKRQRDDGTTEYRLKTLAELSPRFEQPGRFLLIPGEEISSKFGDKPVHLNGINLVRAIPPQRGGNVLETMQNNIDAVLDQRARTGQPMFPHVNHPNFGWGLTAEEIAWLRGEQFFEVFNSHADVHNYGDENHHAVERMWDIILTKRLGELHLPAMYGLASDDTHGCPHQATAKADPGRGWVMVHAGRLTPAHVVMAMERGDFYASTGVTLDDVRVRDDTLEISIRPRPGVSYRTQFIGTRLGYDRTVTTRPADAQGGIFRHYSDDIGAILAERTGPRAVYRMTGDEIYVRAKVISTAAHPNPFVPGELEVAWVQPVQPGRMQLAAR